VGKKQGHALTPELAFQLSPSHVSWPGSPGCATELNSHSFAPVRASYARAFPGEPRGPGGVFAPTTATFLKISGTELYGTTMSTSPSLPKPGSSLPVVALSAINRRPAANRIRGGLLPSPGI